MRSRTSAAPSRSCTPDLNAQHETERVGDEVALAALDPLSGVVTHHLARLRAGSDALAVDDRGGRALVAALQFPAPPVEHVVDMRPDPGRDPGAEVAVNGAARREVPRQHPPLALGLQQVERRVHHLSQAGRARPAARSRRGKQRRNQRPFPVRHVAGSSTPLIEPPPTTPLPLSVPPWWRMQKKNAMFYTTIGRGDHARLMILASMLCADSVGEAEAADAYGPDIRAYIENLQPPEFPFPVDAALAEHRRALFEANCSECHGTYGEDAVYPNLVIAVDVVGTDPAYALTATDGSLDRFYDWVARCYYGELADMAPATGYIAPPLDGIWATAPYLHNGSALASRQPASSAILAAPPPAAHLRFYGARLGIYERLRHGKSEVSDGDARARVYDTTLPGYGNGGHLFGDGLMEAERTAVIEYLKTL
jgi:hypothetical protein